jgi:hypothetical protein
MELRYRHVEAALAAVLQIDWKCMGAFRARLRHLRNIGLPHRLPKPGSGQQIAYSESQALEMLLALALEELGQAPKTAAILSQTIVRQSPYRQDITNHDPLGDMYVAVPRSERASVVIIFGGYALRKFSKTAPPRFAMINVSEHAKLLDQALKAD